jgi:hypothetical protein
VVVDSRVKGLPRIGFLARDMQWSSVTASSSRSRAARSSGSFTARPCTALKVRAASASLPTLFPSSTGSRLSPSSSHQEPSMTWLSPVDRTSGTLTLSAGTLSCLTHHGTPPFGGVAPRRPRWNARQCRWTMPIVCLHWARSSRSVDNVEKFFSQCVAPWKSGTSAARPVTGHPGRTA